MDPEIRRQIIATLLEVRANFMSSSVGLRPVESVVTAAVSALDAWKSAGNAAERYYEAMERAAKKEPAP